MLFRGVCTAIVTPFDTEGKVDFNAFEKLVEMQIKAGVSAIVFMGTTGEASTLTRAEKIEIAKFAIKSVAKRAKVIVGSGSNDTATAIAQSQMFEALGVDGLLVVTPYYNKCTQSGLILHYKAIAESVDLPIILYNVPSRTGVNIEAKTAIELSKINNIVGIKEASGKLTQAAEVIYGTSNEFAVYSGDDALFLPFLAIGGDGVVSVVSNIAPKLMVNLFNKFELGDMDSAIKLNKKLSPFYSAMFVEVNPIPVKNALNILGLNAGTMRLPLSIDMKPENFERVKSAVLDDTIN